MSLAWCPIPDVPGMGGGVPGESFTTQYLVSVGLSWFRNCKNNERNFRSQYDGSRITTKRELPSRYWTDPSPNSLTPPAGKSGSSVSCITTQRRLWETLRSTFTAQQKGSETGRRRRRTYENINTSWHHWCSHTHCIYFRVNLWWIICRSVYFN